MTESRLKERLRDLIDGFDFVDVDEEVRNLLKELLSEVGLRLYKRYEFALITVLPKEAAALMAIMADTYEELCPDMDMLGSVVFGIARIPKRNGEEGHQVLIAQALEMGTNSAAVAATCIIKDYPNVKCLILVGIAGGIPGKQNAKDDVRVGDIVVSFDSGLVQYDMKKVWSDKVIEVRSAMPKPSARFVGAANKLEARRVNNGEKPWEEFIVNVLNEGRMEGCQRPPEQKDAMHHKRKNEDSDLRRKKGRPVVHFGCIGSSNQLLRSKKIRNDLKKRHGIIAIEMEGAGIADACWSFSKDYFIIRGICDYCDGQKNDDWQGYAAVAAAAYARAVLEVS